MHRDLKPANIKIKPDGSVKVLDFGLAKTVTEAAFAAAPGAASLSVAGTVLGTPRYMSPEQILGKPVDTRADIWAFGAVLYEMATGKSPFTGDSLPAIMTAVLRDSPRPVSKLNAELPSQLSRIIDTALQKDCALRYQQVSELRHDLARLDQSTTLTAAAPGLNRAGKCASAGYFPRPFRATHSCVPRRGSAFRMGSHATADRGDDRRFAAPPGQSYRYGRILVSRWPGACPCQGKRSGCYLKRWQHHKKVG